MKPSIVSSILLVPLLFAWPFFPFSSSTEVRERDDGYRGIWFTLGQFSEYGDKYSGGLGTYTANHVPIARYAPEVDRTFFVYGGTAKDERRLRIMVSYYDHARHRVPRPTIILDKDEVDDPHDNPSLALDEAGHLWVFVSGRSRRRPGHVFRSLQPFSTEAFEHVAEMEFTYPQPWYFPDGGFLHLFTRYTRGRELYWQTSPDGRSWSEARKLAGIEGHYQVSHRQGETVGTFFNRHPGGNVDRRTDLYYLQTRDRGRTWMTVDGRPLQVPLEEVDSPARVRDYSAAGLLQYTLDLSFDREARPVLLYLTSRGHEPGPRNGPREWRLTRWTGSEWVSVLVCRSDHNYDMGSLYLGEDSWKIIGPTEPGPQPWQTGGEMALWISRDQGESWTRERIITRDSAYNHSYARRPVQARDPFFAFWADGDPTRFSESRLYFARSDGKRYWQLPYDMDGEFAVPIERTR